MPKKEKDPAKGKTLEALEVSQERRSQFLTEFGYVPDSILVYDPSDRSIDIQIEDGGRAYHSSKVTQELKHSAMRKAFDASGRSCRGKGNGLSRFPQNVGRVIVKLYSEKGQTCYDPFAGHNSRMQLCHDIGRNYIGVDVSENFMRDNEKIRGILIERDAQSFLGNDATIRLIHGSSARVRVQSSSCDFTITSPPYWDLEYYGDEPEQLGKNKTYQGFLDSISKHIEENFRILRPGSFCVWCINDFVKNGIYYAYHADLIPIFQRAGFVLHTIYITDLKNIVGPFIQSILQTKRFPKRHEYCLVFKKPIPKEETK